MSGDGGGSWLQADVMLDRLERAQMAVPHVFEFGEHIGDFLAAVGVFVRDVIDLVPIVCRFGSLPINSFRVRIVVGRC